MQPRNSDSATSEQLVQEGAIQLAVRACEQPPGGYVPSQLRDCSRCGQQVRISNRAFPLADRLTIICTRCYCLLDVGGVR